MVSITWLPGGQPWPVAVTVWPGETDGLLSIKPVGEAGAAPGATLVGVALAGVVVADSVGVVGPTSVFGADGDGVFVFVAGGAGCSCVVVGVLGGTDVDVVCGGAVVVVVRGGAVVVVVRGGAVVVVVRGGAVVVVVRRGAVVVVVGATVVVVVVGATVVVVVGHPNGTRTQSSVVDVVGATVVGVVVVSQMGEWSPTAPDDGHAVVDGP